MITFFRCAIGSGVLFFLSIVSCRTASPNSADTREFQVMAASVSEPANDVLLSQSGGASYQSFRDMYDWGRGDERLHLRVEFPALTARQFQHLKKAYGFGLSRITYRPGKAYQLRDFLTPMMQAVLNSRFRAEINANYSHLTSNCWSTAYEVLHSAATDTDTFSVYLQPEGLPALRAFQGAGGKPLLKTTTLQALAAHPDFRFGDLVLQFEPDGALEHAVIVVDRDVYFEKTAVITESPYRLVHTNDWAYAIQDGGWLELWRIEPKILQAPEKLFQSTSLQRQGTDLKKVHVPLLKADISIHDDEFGRSRLNDAALRPLVIDKPPGY